MTLKCVVMHFTVLHLKWHVKDVPVHLLGYITRALRLVYYRHMQPVKNSVALVIKNDKGEILIVKRPEDEPGELAGVWGFPAITLKPNEPEADAVMRAGKVKLGVDIVIVRKIGTKTADRGDYLLSLSDYEVQMTNGAVPAVPQPDNSMTQYVDWQFTDDASLLFPAARKGSLCSQVYLESLNIKWSVS